MSNHAGQATQAYARLQAHRTQSFIAILILCVALALPLPILFGASLMAAALMGVGEILLAILFYRARKKHWQARSWSSLA